MPVLTRHAVTPADKSLLITTDERDPAAGNMSHVYTVSVTPDRPASSADYDVPLVIRFQHGPVAENGVNGITNEALLDIVIDRLDGAQLGPFACQYNEDARNLIAAGLERLKDRTRDRIVRGVEGQSKA